MSEEHLLPNEAVFLESARQGQLLNQPAISIYMIALLRHPNCPSSRKDWYHQLLRALEEKKLAKSYQVTNHTVPLTQGSYLIIHGYHVRASDYRDYVILQRLFGNSIPSDSLEYCWIPELIPESESIAINPVTCPSDTALGAHRREQLQAFLGHTQDHKNARQAEWVRWYKEGQRIQASSSRPLSATALARKIKKSLSLPDSESTIRQRLGEVRKLTCQD